MVEDFRRIYDNPAGTRRAIISRGRKNAKTTESAMIVLLHLCGPEAVLNSQLFSSAQSRDQAAILFDLAAKMVRMSPTLEPFVTIRETVKQLACRELDTLYRALSAEATTAYGFSPALTIHDELGQVKGPRSQLYDALETATAAHESPLSIIISTQAPTDADLLSILIDDALAGHDPRTVIRLDAAPDDLDPFSEKAVRAANPAFDFFMNREEVMGMAATAKRMPSRQPEYENLVLNRRVETSAPFVTRQVWADNGKPPAEIDGLEVWGGLDLSATTDLTALVLVSEAGDVVPTFWLPSEGLTDKARQDRVPYDTWEKQGHLETTPGRTIQYGFVAKRLREIFSRCHVRSIAFDRQFMNHLRPWLDRAGFTDDEMARFVEFGQGYVSMTPALRELESLLLDAQLMHGNHPVLQMCAANAVVVPDEAGNRKFSKRRASGRIDGMVALAMAVSVRNQEMAAHEDAGFVEVW